MSHPTSPLALLRRPGRAGIFGCLSLLGCTGSLDLPSGGASDGQPPGGRDPGTIGGDSPGGVEVECEHGTASGLVPLTRLSNLQYRNTVTDLLGHLGADTLAPEIDVRIRAIPDDSTGEIFRGLDHRIGPEHIQGYFNVGVALGNALRDDEALLESVAFTCATEATLTEGCAETFLNRFLRLVFRRPPTSEELAEYLSLNDGERAPAEAIRAMVIVALSSPRFLHHVEVDGTPDARDDSRLAIDPFELASRLSYTFWQTMPDERLLALAEDGSLTETEVYAVELERVSSDPRAEETLWQFWKEWLLLEKFSGFETARPAFQALVAGEPFGEPGHDHYADMVEEVRELVRLFTFERNAPLADLLTTDISVTRSEDLARLYGTESYSGSGPYPTLPSGQRAGLLQRAALIVSNLEQTNPFHRGALVRRNVLCDPLPQPDPNALPSGALDPPPFDPEQTTRERFAAKVEGPLCVTCHASFSDIGYVLEAFDAVGRYRTRERVFDETNGELLAELPIDLRGHANIASFDEAPVDGPLELNARIVDSKKVEACLSEKYFQFVARRTLVRSSLDACVTRGLTEILSEGEEAGLFTAFQSIARFPSFFQRKVGPR